MYAQNRHNQYHFTISHQYSTYCPKIFSCTNNTMCWTQSIIYYISENIIVFGILLVKDYVGTIYTCARTISMPSYQQKNRVFLWWKSVPIVHHNWYFYNQIKKKKKMYKKINNPIFLHHLNLFIYIIKNMFLYIIHLLNHKINFLLSLLDINIVSDIKSPKKEHFFCW